MESNGKPTRRLSGQNAALPHLGGEVNITENEFKILKQNMAARDPKQPARAAAMLEKQIEQTCTQILEHDGWRSLKTDPVSDKRRGKGFGELGMADVLYVRYGFCVNPQWAEVLWIEFKRPGGVVADHQRAWHQLERKRRAVTLIAGEDFPATIEGFIAFYEKSGLKRTRGAA